MSTKAVYAVPVGVAAAIALGAWVPTLAAPSVPDLSPSTPAQVIASVFQVSQHPFSGTFGWQSNLALPSLPDSAGSGGSGSSLTSALSMLSGTHQASVWSGGAGLKKVAVTDTPGQETDVIRNGDQLWVWSSKNQTATHETLPATASGGGGSVRGGVTPQQLADTILQRAGTSTSITLGTAEYVAGQPSYQLVLTPAGAGASVSTVGHISIDVAASGPFQGMVTRVSVWEKGASSAVIQAGYSHLDPSAPSPQTFTFTPPSGAKVHYVQAPTGNLMGNPEHATYGGQQGVQSAPQTKEIGTGWGEVTEVSVQSLNLPTKEIDMATTSVNVGGVQGRLLDTGLVNALLMPDGHCFVGAVDVATLKATAAAAA